MLGSDEGGFKDLAAKSMPQADLRMACVGTRCDLVAVDRHLHGSSEGERADQFGVDWEGDLDALVVSSDPSGTRAFRRVKFRHGSRSVLGRVLGSFCQALWRGVVSVCHSESIGSCLLHDRSSIDLCGVHRVVHQGYRSVWCSRRD